MRRNKKRVILIILILFILGALGFVLLNKLVFKTPTQLLESVSSWSVYSDKKITFRTPWKLQSNKDIVGMYEGKGYIFGFAENNFDLNLVKCNFKNCSPRFYKEFCVDDQGRENILQKGCIELVDKNYNYTYYQFYLFCDLTVKGIDSDECGRILSTILSSISFIPNSGGETWKVYDNGIFAFQYPANFSYSETPGRVSIYTDDMKSDLLISFITLAKDSNQSLMSYVFEIADAEGRTVSGLDDHAKQETYLISNYNKDDQVAYMIEFPNNPTRVMRINEYIENYRLNEYDQAVDSIVKSFGFTK